MGGGFANAPDTNNLGELLLGLCIGLPDWIANGEVAYWAPGWASHGAKRKEWMEEMKQLIWEQVSMPTAQAQALFSSSFSHLTACTESMTPVSLLQLRRLRASPPPP